MDFNDLLESSTICSNCFREVAHEHENNYEYDPTYPGGAKPARLAVPSVDHRRVQCQTTREARHITPGMKTVCNCGVFSVYQQERPLSALQVERRARRIAQRLGLSPEAVESTASSLKREESNDLADNVIFRRAARG